LNKITISLPSLGENVESGVIVSLLVSPGELISLNQTILEVETDKVTAEVPSDQEGKIIDILVKEGDEISEGDAILTLMSEAILEEANTIAITATAQSTEEEFPSEPMKGLGIESVKNFVSNRGSVARATPRAKKLSRELGIEINQVKPKGSAILEEDIKSYIRQTPQRSINEDVKTVEISQSWGEVRRESMSGVMKATASNMAHAWKTIPHAWLTEDINITSLEAERKSLNAEQEDIKLSATVFIVKCISRALQKFPLFNASIDSKSHEILYKEKINIGVAVDTEYGLFVPVIKDAAHMGLNAIAGELIRLSERAKTKKLAMDDLEGGGFTISNLGTIGSTSIYPIINPPQVAILGVARYKLDHAGQKIVTMTIGFDHRLINGADAARFLQFVKQLMESPVRILA